MKIILFVATNHGKLTSAQILDAENTLGVTEVLYLQDFDANLSNQIAQIPAMATPKEVANLAKKVVTVAEKAGSQFLLVAGEPLFVIAATILAERLVQGVMHDLTKSFLVENSGASNFTTSRKMEVVQSTTERESVESVTTSVASTEGCATDGKVVKTSVFVHKQWRRNLLSWLPEFS